MLEEKINAFAAPNEVLHNNTNNIATIRTEDENPIYSKLYPYPLAVSELVNNETSVILWNNIIRPSRSPFNNPSKEISKLSLLLTSGNLIQKPLTIKSYTRYSSYSLKLWKSQILYNT